MATAIQTYYGGHFYRSRLEARWSFFMDVLKVRHNYETEGYVLDQGDCYLPDFFLPDLDCYVEIKGAKPTEAEWDKTSGFAREIGKRDYICYGQIMEQIPAVWNGPTFATESACCFFPDGAQDAPYFWCECSDCGAIGIEYNGRSDRLPCKDTGCTRSIQGDKGYNFNSSRLLSAYETAQQARFEHGERPSTEGPQRCAVSTRTR